MKTVWRILQMYTNEITKMDSRFFFCLGEIIHESTLASFPKHTYALHHCNQNTIQLRILNFGRKKDVCKTPATEVVLLVQLNTFAMRKWGQFEIYTFARKYTANDLKSNKPQANVIQFLGLAKCLAEGWNSVGENAKRLHKHLFLSQRMD